MNNLIHSDFKLPKTELNSKLFKIIDNLDISYQNLVEIDDSLKYVEFYLDQTILKKITGSFEMEIGQPKSKHLKHSFEAIQYPLNQQLIQKIYPSSEIGSIIPITADYELMKSLKIVDDYGFTDCTDINTLFVHLNNYQDATKYFNQYIKPKKCEKILTTDHNKESIRPLLVQEPSEQNNDKIVQGYENGNYSNCETINNSIMVYFNQVSYRGLVFNQTFYDDHTINTDSLFFKQFTELVLVKTFNYQSNDLKYQEIISSCHNIPFSSLEELKIVVNKLEQQFNGVQTVVPDYNSIKNYLIKNYQLTTRVEDKIKYTTLVDYIIQDMNIAEYDKFVKSILSQILTELELTKKRYSDGFYWYGISKKATSVSKVFNKPERLFDYNSRVEELPKTQSNQSNQVTFQQAPVLVLLKKKSLNHPSKAITCKKAVKYIDVSDYLVNREKAFGSCI